MKTAYVFFLLLFPVLIFDQGNPKWIRDDLECLAAKGHCRHLPCTPFRKVGKCFHGIVCCMEFK